MSKKGGKVKGIFLIMCFFSLLFLFCGAPQEPTTMPTKTAQELYNAPLNESEMQRFLKALPVFLAEMKKVDKELSVSENSGELLASLQAYATLNKEIPGLDAKLRSAGMGWNEFWPVCAKTFMAFSAVMYDSGMAVVKKEMANKDAQIAQLEKQLKDPNIPESQKQVIRSSIEAFKSSLQIFSQMDTVFNKVPQINKALVKKYIKELSAILERD